MKTFAHIVKSIATTSGIMNATPGTWGDLELMVVRPDGIYAFLLLHGGMVARKKATIRCAIRHDDELGMLISEQVDIEMACHAPTKRSASNRL